MSPFKKNFNFSINSFSTTGMTKHNKTKKKKKNPEARAIRKRENKKMKKFWGSQENGGRGRAKSLCAASVNAMRLLCEWSRAGISAKGKGKATIQKCNSIS